MLKLRYLSNSAGAATRGPAGRRPARPRFSICSRWAQRNGRSAARHRRASRHRWTARAGPGRACGAREGVRGPGGRAWLGAAAVFASRVVAQGDVPHGWLHSTPLPAGLGHCPAPGTGHGRGRPGPWEDASAFTCLRLGARRAALGTDG